MKKIITLVILIGIGFVQKVSAQQDPNFTLYNFNFNIINPATVGSNDIQAISIGYRSQWIGLSDAPNTQVFNFTKPLKRGLGLGVSIVRDQVFVLQETDITVDISYKLKLSDTHDLYFGIKTGGSFVDIDFAKTGAVNDPLFTENQNFFNAQFGAGLYMAHKNYYISISTPNFLNGKRYVKQGNIPSAAVDNLHVYSGAGYHFEVSEMVRITTAIMHRATQGAPSSTDINATITYNKIQAGINHRVNEMYSVFTLFDIADNVRFGAAYDFIASEINQVNDNGSLELLLRYQF
jgi:type IX secretion system PorP/SprF family membrane protein